MTRFLIPHRKAGLWNEAPQRRAFGVLFVQIIKMLTGGELYTCKILDAFNITQPTLSHHMKEYKDYLFHIKQSCIGTLIGLSSWALIGLFVALFSS